jgi:hypothetical protein
LDFREAGKQVILALAHSSSMFLANANHFEEIQSEE